MAKLSVKNPRFLKTATRPKDYPLLKDPSGGVLPEVAVAGRSNVGKSSLLNHLFQTKSLVRTSSTPGKTQMLNFFSLNDEVVFVDLPGYGFAQVPLNVRKEWGPMVQAYLEKREPLRLILFLFDIRRVPNEDDRQFVEWGGYTGVPMILVLTKVDKVKSNERVANTQKILRAFGENALPHVHYSVTKNVGRMPLLTMMQDALEGERDG